MNLVQHLIIFSVNNFSEKIKNIDIYINYFYYFFLILYLKKILLKIIFDFQYQMFEFK